MALKGTFEPCENGTNDLAVQRFFSILLNVFSIDMSTFKMIKSKKKIYQEGFNKALSDVIEHQLFFENFPNIMILTE